ncbi:HD-GYP domain-containing protein [Bacillus benzoevorans]|uniref:HD-GYP domain-containing protein (C-di-GMP phosphodiesterase class II) n=1 Tax=Bacillus benzoevorans TaxID=1456 RepID=A0A7X0HR58_9BACI|nr:HD-GYP domain-containing protein [Bacillus benzoevorans]MBB6445403.1 HD-GYP domain-containing protein (c-di-GMP phosphodiesterase class II) [Bacillus benzoevorans]
MRVLVRELQPGCILIEDVYGMTNRPLIPKQTVLTNELIAILQAFLVPSVEIGSVLVNGTAFIPDGNAVQNGEKDDFITAYLHAVQASKAEFKLWQSGVPVDITRIRMILLPLLEKIETGPDNISLLHRLSNEEEYLYQHMTAVGLISAFIAARLKFSKGEIVQTALAGFLADCGMSKIESSVLQKKSPLTAKEYKEIKFHASYSYNMAKNIPFLSEGAKVAIIQHHERMDGSGYIFGLKGNEIHPKAKIIAAADIFHAMTSERLYRSKQSPYKVLELMEQDYFGKLDLAVIKALGEGIIHLSQGSIVKLSNGEIGEVLAVNRNHLVRPLVKITNTGQLINMLEERFLYIDEIIGLSQSVSNP